MNYILNVMIGTFAMCTLKMFPFKIGRKEFSKAISLTNLLARAFVSERGGKRGERACERVCVFLLKDIFADITF